MTTPTKSVTKQYNSDVEKLGGYSYIACPTVSTIYNSERRKSAVVDAFAELGMSSKGQRVLDVGTGDGAYVPQWKEVFQPAHLEGIDLAEKAVEVAQSRHGNPACQFRVGSAEKLPYGNGSFDLAIFRDVIHHIDNPLKALEEGARVAKRIIVIDPNGYNPIVKGLEKFSPYHRTHGEKSYAPLRLAGWLKKAGCQIEYQKFFGIIPMQCPDWFAKILKSTEGIFESLPIGRNIYTGSVILIARSPISN